MTAINPLTDDKFALFNDDDRQFLAQFFVAYPQIGDNFDRYLSFPAHLRSRVARVDLFDIKRAGWVRHGISDPEDVHQHMMGLVNMIEGYFEPRLMMARKMVPEEYSQMQQFARKIMNMAAVHDYAEAIVGDFTPHDAAKKSGAGKITEEDKDRVERLAARVLFEGKPAQLSLIEEYIDQKTPASRLMFDFDKSHACQVAMFYEGLHPEQREAGLFKAFFDYAMPRLKTNMGRQFLQEMADHKEEVLAMIAEHKVAKGASAGMTR